MNSRWTSNPITKNGHIVATRPNVPGDLEILKWLGRYPLLTADDLVSLTNRPYKSVIRRINKLKRKPNQAWPRRWKSNDGTTISPPSTSKSR